MGSKGLQIVYNLEWKRGGPKDKSNVVGMYDIPCANFNWKVFKSYLLKNSGAIVDDIRLSYVSSDGKEFPIESQLDFQIALYSFRQRARNNDVITLRLDNVDKTRPKCQNVPDDVPTWFKEYMKEFKKEVVEEVTASVVASLSSDKTQSGRKVNEEPKRMRKSAENNEKEIHKSVKLERKSEEVKIKEMPVTPPLQKTIPKVWEMDVMAVGNAEVMAPRMLGGEIYRQEWRVRNTGSKPWTSKTELRYAWGSGVLRPVDLKVPCPLLKPGEEGSVGVFLKVPISTGEYEAFWYFVHNGKRFGRRLGCHVIVDCPWFASDTETEPETSALYDLGLFSSDQDTHSITSARDSDAARSESEFVVVADKKPVVQSSQYAYIDIDGKSQPVPRILLRPEFIVEAERDYGVDNSEEQKFIVPQKNSIYNVDGSPGMTESGTASSCIEPATAINEAPSTPKQSPLFNLDFQTPSRISPFNYGYGCPRSFAGNYPLNLNAASQSPYTSISSGYRYGYPGLFAEECSLTPATAATPQPSPMISDAIVNGAVNVASSAINTARSVINMITSSNTAQPHHGSLPHEPLLDTPRNHAQNLLREMGFLNRELNSALLERHNENVAHVVNELLSNKKV